MTRAHHTVCACRASGRVQDKVQAPHHAQAPASSAQPTGTTSSSGHHPGSREAQQAATAAALSGPVCARLQARQ